MQRCARLARPHCPTRPSIRAPSPTPPTPRIHLRSCPLLTTPRIPHLRFSTSTEPPASMPPLQAAAIPPPPPPPPPKPTIVREKLGDTTRIYRLQDEVLSFSDEPLVHKRANYSIRERAAHSLRNFFLPAGYPDTVSADYWPFHRWWILSSLAGSANYVLSMQCLLTAVGMPVIGSVPISAGISWVLKDGLGSMMSMFVAGRFARRFDAEPKSSRWRADILHNVGVGVEILTPLFPAYFLLMASLANTLKGIAGLVSGATRASFNRGFAISENLGEVTAKAQGQGIAAYLVGMGLGIGLSFLWPIQQLFYTFPLFLFLASVHLTAGYHALCNVTLTSLNQQRAFLLIEQYVRAAAEQAVMARIETPDEVRVRERFVAGARPWLKHLELCPPLHSTRAYANGANALAALLRTFASKRYVLSLTGDGSGRIAVLLKSEAEARDVLEALFHAVVIVHQQPDPLKRTDEHVRVALPFASERFSTFFAQLSTSQWKDSDLLLHAVGHNRVAVE